MLVDPKAIKRILHSTGYRYPKAVEATHLNKIVAGNGLVAAQGLDFIRRPSFAAYTYMHNFTGQAHHRQRKIMNPAFSTLQVQSFVPLFYRTASKV